MKRLFPLPFTSLAVFALWLVIASSFSVGNVVLAAVVAIAIPLWSSRFWPNPPRLVRPLMAVGFFFKVCGDIIVANIEVARRVLGPLDRIKPAFVDVPLDIEDPFVATLLAGVVTLTPGTVSIDIDLERRLLHVHALNAPDPAVTIAQIKSRYETPLKEMFRC